MKWWYSNDEDSNEGKEMKSCEYCSNDNCKNVGGAWYCLDCPECEVKESKMEFDKSRVYTSVNADELHEGDKVIVADTLAELKMYVEQNIDALKLLQIRCEGFGARFTVPTTRSWRNTFPLAYLVERAEKKYRPFRDTDELIKVWDAKIGTPNWGTGGDLTMPHIWVQDKERPQYKYLISGFMGNDIQWGSYIFNMQELFDSFEFLDGTPCGVEE